MMPGGGLDVLFGPFLTLMAPIPGSNDPRSQPHHAGKENVQYHEPSSESEGGHSDDDFAPSTNTNRITSLKIGMKNVNHDPGRPAVRIFTSRGYDLSRPDVIEGANILLAMGDYLESKGPLLKDIEKK
ncbi:uncharacterized protein BDCG_02881 [Blastomyces dermatitidis ER-3]|uniref:Uncharacterized protein n=1 Tax=Ajellomyces dermatitidis (strain ER-3 / ATCC MYA-2586) TaxID=559297 RepID=A0ABP2EUZ7_AJEDR|nr:uncharacterized protein BDCG_02881 [Blastomyces dermatitidis ER-3]EEQ87761.2 hypothetical protein BDCG_02881 [Blastomyces dermatitidis ER-3]